MMNIAVGFDTSCYTTSVAADGADNRSFWFNELGMSSYYNTLEAGETYTFTAEL